MTSPSPLPTSLHWRLGGLGAHVATMSASSIERVRETVNRYVREVLAMVDPSRPDSLVNSLVNGARREPVPAVFAAVVGEALDAAELSGGLVNPFPLDSASSAPWRRIQLHAAHDGFPDRITMPAGPPLRLERLALALVCDWCCAALARELGAATLVGLGSDAASIGNEPRDGWRVEVAGRTIRLRPGTALAATPDRDGHRLVVGAATCALARVACDSAIASPEGPRNWIAAHGLAAAFIESTADRRRRDGET